MSDYVHWHPTFLAENKKAIMNYAHFIAWQHPIPQNCYTWSALVLEELSSTNTFKHFFARTFIMDCISGAQEHE